MISPDVVLGKDVVSFQPELVNLYGCSIGDGTKASAFIETHSKSGWLVPTLVRSNATILCGAIVAGGLRELAAACLHADFSTMKKRGWMPW